MTGRATRDLNTSGKRKCSMPYYRDTQCPKVLVGTKLEAATTYHCSVCEKIFNFKSRMGTHERTPVCPSTGGRVHLKEGLITAAASSAGPRTRNPITLLSRNASLSQEPYWQFYKDDTDQKFSNLFQMAHYGCICKGTNRVRKHKADASLNQVKESHRMTYADQLD